MTLTTFLDVKADPPKPDEAKVDLLKNLNEAALVFNDQQQVAVDPLHTVEYVELYNHRLAKRRRLCRTLALLLALFLLLDIGVVLYIALRMRHGAAEPGAASTLTCRLRFRSGGQQEERTERLTASNTRVLMQPMWATDGHPTVMHDLRRGFTLLRAPSVRLCFIKHAPWRQDDWSTAVSEWAKESHDVLPEQTNYVRLVVMHPPISLEQLMSYGNTAWDMCHRYVTFRVQPLLPPAAGCPMIKCLPCPSGVYLRNSMGCQTCECGPAGRSRRAAAVAAASAKKTLELDEGVLPDVAGGGRAVHTIDVIEL